MLKKRYRVLAVLAMAASAFLLCSCEDDGGLYVDYDTPCFSISGDWRGSGDCGYVYRDMRLYDDDGCLSGSVLWPGAGWRDFSGYRSGTRLSIRISDGDKWDLYYDDDYLRGTGHGPYDDYGLCFRRR